ncbi:MAG TPA: hypothetical protein VMV21_18265 [Vicinamibacteria bacterium]|nr:hypothetical protein [Vicinamibacteria bacterium]
MRVLRHAFLVAVSLSSPLPGATDEVAELRAELGRVRGEVAALEGEKKRWEAGVSELRESMRAVSEGVDALKDRATSSVAAPFLSAPPPSSDTVGVAKVAVFAPRLEAEAQRRRDIVFLKVKRVEAGLVRLVAEVELPADQAGVDLPVDQSGALYIVEWTTSDGNAYNLQLKDGTSALTTALVQVKNLQSQGRFIFVGYRVE